MAIHSSHAPSALLAHTQPQQQPGTTTPQGPCNSDLTIQQPPHIAAMVAASAGLPGLSRQALTELQLQLAQGQLQAQRQEAAAAAAQAAQVSAGMTRALASASQRLAQALDKAAPVAAAVLAGSARAAMELPGLLPPGGSDGKGRGGGGGGDGDGEEAGAGGAGQQQEAGQQHNTREEGAAAGSSKKQAAAGSADRQDAADVGRLDGQRLKQAALQLQQQVTTASCWCPLHARVLAPAEQQRLCLFSLYTFVLH